MKRTRQLWIGAAFLVVIAALTLSQRILSSRAVAEAAGVQAPIFEVDPLWPKPLPNHWLMGNTIGVAADAKDNIWIIHRAGSLEPNELHLKNKIAMCCAAADPVLVFDPAGNLINHWGGPGQGYNWPDSNHGITID